MVMMDLNERIEWMLKVEDESGFQFGLVLARLPRFRRSIFKSLLDIYGKPHPDIIPEDPKYIFASEY